MDNVSTVVHNVLRVHHNSTPAIGVPEVFKCGQSVGRKCRLIVVCKALFHLGKAQSAGMEERVRAVVDGGTRSETLV